MVVILKEGMVYNTVKLAEWLGKSDRKLFSSHTGFDT